MDPRRSGTDLDGYPLAASLEVPGDIEAMTVGHRLVVRESTGGPVRAEELPDRGR